MNDYPMTYERILRNAFKVDDRYGDPAKAATTDAYSDFSIDTAKSALAYAASILIQETRDDRVEKELKGMRKKILGAKNTGEMDALLERMLEISQRKL